MPIIQSESGLRPREYFLLGAAVFLFYLPGVCLRDFWIYNEGRRAIIALEMLRRGDWLIPRLMTEPIFTKPPLFYWAEIIAFKLTGGPSDWAARLPSLFAGVVDVLAIAGILSNLVGRRAAWIGAGMLAVFPVHVWMAGNAEPEMFFVAPGTAAMWVFTCWWKRTAPSPANLTRTDAALPWIFWFLLGLSFLTKGPMIPLMIAFSVMIWLWIAQKSLFRLIHPLAGWFVLLLPALVWAGWLWIKGIPPSVFWHEAASHLEDDAPHQQSRLFYLSELGRLIFPWWYVFWCVLLFLTYHSLRRARGHRIPAFKVYLLEDNGERLLILVWVLVSLVLLSAVSSKRYYYGLILTPALAALSGMWGSELLQIAKDWNWGDRVCRRMKIACAFLTVILLIAAGCLALNEKKWNQYTGKNTPDNSMICIALACCVGCAAGALKFGGKLHKNAPKALKAAIGGLIAGMGVVGLIYTIWIHPQMLNRLYSYKLAMRDLRAHIPNGKTLFSYKPNHTVWFYTEEFGIPVIESVRKVQAYWTAHPDALGVTFSEQWQDLREHAGAREVFRTDWIPVRDAQLVLFRTDPAAQAPQARNR